MCFRKSSKEPPPVAAHPDHDVQRLRAGLLQRRVHRGQSLTSNTRRNTQPAFVLILQGHNQPKLMCTHARCLSKFYSQSVIFNFSQNDSVLAQQKMSENTLKNVNFLKSCSLRVRASAWLRHCLDDMLALSRFYLTIILLDLYRYCTLD